MSEENKPIYVTRPYLPPLSEVLPYLERIWQSQILTNSGPFHVALENDLANYLGVENISLFSNGTLALVTALQALRITGEVITTPFSFVATSHSLLWNSIKPVFVDIDRETLNLDPQKIEAAITPQTTAIVPVHVYGRPCAVEAIEKTADIYGLKVIYDGAHAFGVRCHGGSIFQHGDLSVLSFHATKVFNTFEGGAIVSPDAKTKKRIDFLKNFGFADEVTVVAPGINAKMNEFQAALGLVQLQHIDAAIAKRQQVDAYYRQELSTVLGIYCIPLPTSARHNFAYFPILVTSGYPLARDALYLQLRAQNIYARRYFYPLISEFPMYRALPSASRENLPIAHAIAEQVLCLPIYPDLDFSDLERIVQAIARNALR